MGLGTGLKQSHTEGRSSELIREDPHTLRSFPFSNPLERWNEKQGRTNLCVLPCADGWLLSLDREPVEEKQGRGIRVGKLKVFKAETSRTMLDSLLTPQSGLFMSGDLDHPIKAGSQLPGVTSSQRTP